MAQVYPRLAVSVGIWRAGQVLLALRSRAPMAGVWTFPGGHVEPGERVAEAALREVAEETGLAVRLRGDPIVHEIILRDPAGALLSHHVLLVHAAIAEGADEPTAASDAAAVRWIRPEAIADLATTPGLAGFVDETRRRAAGRP